MRRRYSTRIRRSRTPHLSLKSAWNGSIMIPYYGVPEGVLYGGCIVSMCGTLRFYFIFLLFFRLLSNYFEYEILNAAAACFSVCSFSFSRYRLGFAQSSILLLRTKYMVVVGRS